MSDTDSRVGTDFGPYHLKRLLGRGGMGEVYEAEDTRKDRTVALKVLSTTTLNDPVFRKRLQREAHSAGRLQEPHVVPIHDYGEIDGVMYVDMRYIEGTDLRKVLTRYGPMSPARAVAIIRQIAAALDAAHETGLVHRDVKPENILITRDDFAYLVDFGIANAKTDERLTEFGTAVGTYAYMAPERFTNAEATSSVDVYALACVLHECLTGAQPYPGDSVGTVISSHMLQPVPRPSAVRPGIPEAFDAVIARGMAKDPKDRYATAGDLAAAAHQALESRDKDKADTILARSESATVPGTLAAAASLGFATAPPSPPSFSTPPPSSTPPGSTPPPSTSPPFVAASSQPPYQPPGMGGTGGWGPPGPTGPYGPGGPPSGGPPWQPPPSGPMPSAQPPKRNWGPIIAAIIAFVVVVILAVLAIVLIPKFTKSGDDTTTTTTTSSATTTTSTKTRTSTTRTTPPTTGQSGASARLMSILPKGFDSTNCKPINPVTDALATVDCEKNTMPGGPDVARFSLFPDQATLDRHFDTAIKEDDQLQNCPGSDTPSPTTWHYTQTPDKVEGQVACGTYKGGPDVLWTRNEDLMLADGQGPDMAALHDWWLKYG